jgi:hypothetical protein
MGSGCAKLYNNNKLNVDDTISNIISSNELINWKSSNQLYKYHWWPMKEIKNTSYLNNLYCNDGGLDKYDKIFNTNSKEYQMIHHFRSHDSNECDADWAGFCDKATILSCLYEYPKNAVFVCVNNNINIFNVRDIEMLMIIATNNSIKHNMSIFLGERNRFNTINKYEQEPYPSDLLDMLKIMCASNEPFAMDIDSGSAVWNYSYNKVTVTEHDECLLEHTKPTYGKTKYLNFIINSEAYPTKNQCLWGYINTVECSSNDGNILRKREQWITKTHPDFIWKHFAKDTAWEGKCEINPEIDAGIVYKIWKRSISDKYQEILTIE